MSLTDPKKNREPSMFSKDGLPADWVDELLDPLDPGETAGNCCEP